jgi:predicted ATPase/class 3 adenylate cyclase
VTAQGTQRADLPHGTVTLLFTDIEGSTQLLRALGARYAEVQDRHRRLLRGAFVRNGGIEVDTQGDAFMVAFRSAAQAADAALEAQHALAGEPWPDERRVLVRMGLHTGEPERGPEGYVGIDVVRASRICAVAHGGQILVSQLTRDLLTDAGLGATDLGSHRLKDIPERERLYQLVAEGLPATFPPLRTLGGATLPALHHRLVGRQADLAGIRELLARPDVRLVTITGPGGAGKSRLALEAASVAAVDRPVHLVGLAPVSDPALVLAEVARAVGAREAPGKPLAEIIAERLRGSKTLLFLDNLEHLTAAAHDIAALLDHVPDLDLLATSRTPLRLSGEHVLPLDPLDDEAASTLFVELAAARGVVLREDTLPSVREICRRLDGLPLAIELVAARLVVLPPARVLQALDEGLALEMEGPIDLPERQRTLRATIAWSYGLLSESERELHGALAVFAGGCTLDDARNVARAASGFYRDLESLVAWSLVRSDVADGDARLSMLETVRQDAIARLSAEHRLDELRERHAERFLALALASEDRLAGPEQAACLERLEDELDNIRAMLDWCLTAGRVDGALRTLSALSRFWRAHGHVSEARQWLSASLALADGVADDIRADALWTAARQAEAQSDWDAAAPLTESALELFRASGRKREESFALAWLGFLALTRDDPERAAELCGSALMVARELGDERATSGALLNLAEVRSVQGAHQLALGHYEEAVALRRRLDDPLLVCDATYNLGVGAFRSGSFARARVSFEESLALARQLGESIHRATALFMLAELDLLEGNAAAAGEQVLESLAVYTELENDRERAECLVVLAGVVEAHGDPEEAARLLGASDALRGDSPPDSFEIAVLDRLAPRLDAVLGSARHSELRHEGARAGYRDQVAAVAMSGAEE